MLDRSFVGPDGLADINTEIIGQVIQGSNIYYSIVSRELIPYGISRSQFDVLSYLYYFGHQGAINLTEIACSMHLSKANVSGVLSRLEEKELIFFEKCRKDARIREVNLSNKGRALMEKVFPLIKGVLDQSLESFDNKEKTELARLLVRLSKELNEFNGKGLKRN